MSTTVEDGGKKVPRRRFLKWAGAFAAVVVVGTGLASAADVVLKPRKDSTSTSAVSQASASTSDVTNSSTAASQVTTQTTQAASPTATATITASTNASLSSSAQIPASTFSIFWITDTQFLSETNPALFRMTTNWILNNWTAYNGKMVIHTGDLVQTGDQDVEWENAHQAMSVLMENNIPYSWCAGNHDDFVGGDSTSGWIGNEWEAFNPTIVNEYVNSLDYSKWVSDYHAGMNTALTFSANDLNFLVVNLEWNGDPTVVQWLDNLLDEPAYANHHVIIAPHAYMDAWGLLNDPRWGPTLADFVSGLTTVLDKHASQVFLTLNGHFATDQGYNTSSPINSRNQLMFDRQDCRDATDSLSGRGVDDADSSTPDSSRVGGSTVMILTFDTSKNQISAKTYDVFTGTWRTDQNEKYTIPMFPVQTATQTAVQS